MSSLADDISAEYWMGPPIKPFPLRERKKYPGGFEIHVPAKIEGVHVWAIWDEYYLRRKYVQETMYSHLEAIDLLKRLDAAISRQPVFFGHSVFRDSAKRICFEGTPESEQIACLESFIIRAFAYDGLSQEAKCIRQADPTIFFDTVSLGTISEIVSRYRYK